MVIEVLRKITMIDGLDNELLLVIIVIVAFLFTKGVGGDDYYRWD